LPNERIRDEVSICQLLTHTSGVGSYWNQSYEDAKQELGSFDGFLAIFMNYCEAARRSCRRTSAIIRTQVTR
jgi:hypothetical protein